MQLVMADMPSIYAGPIVGVVTALCSINFIIMSRRAGGHGILVVILFITSVGLFISASVAKPFNARNPYQIHLQHEINYGSPNATVVNGTIPIAAVVDSLMLMEQVQAYSLKLGDFATRSWGLNDTTCNEAEVICRISNPGGAQLPENQPPMVTVISDEREPNSTRRNVTVEVYSPESYIHEISTSVPSGVRSHLNFLSTQGAYFDKSILFIRRESSMRVLMVSASTPE
jgi:hypothetical protein